MNGVTTQPVISVRDVAVSYGGRRVLHGINLDIARGETVVLLGGSGSGKSTLLRHIIGLEQPEAGQILVNGIDLAAATQKDLNKVRRSIGVAFQDAALFNSMSLKENVAFPLRELTRLAESTISLMTWMKLSVVGLAEFGDSSPRELSGGMRKRAAVARALSLDPEILVFDEPSAGLDPIVAAGVDELILNLKRAFSMTVVVVTHELASAFRIADRMAMLYQGSLIAVGTKEEMRQSDHPRIRQFFDRIPDKILDPAVIDEYLENYLKGGLQ
jgi:phospholipid/cholesterol/gamma-HCH transport system ATP-binding protein